MIGSEKLGRKISSLAKAKKPEMKKASPRNPLKDLNVCTISPPQASAETQRQGYFRFLRSSSSSKEDSIPKYKSQPRFPKSAPPNSKTLSSKSILIPNSFHDKNPPKTIRSKKPVKPNTTDLLHRWNQRRPNSREITGGITEPDLILQVDANGKIGSCADSTPERVIELAGLKIGSGLEEGKQQFSATPRSNTTPPIMASISPEVPCGSFVAPTPVCFATGHVLPGVQSRRKCRPRGILTVGEEQSSMSGFSSVPQPLAQASVCWFSSPLEFGKRSDRNASSSQVRTFDFPNEASVNWLLSPSDAVEELGTVSAKAKISNLDASFGMETTPSSGNVILRTPNSNSSISSFSVIVQRAEESSRIRAHISHKEKGIYRYDDVPDISPFYEKSCSNSVAASTPSSYTNSRRNGVISPLELDSASEGMEAMRTLTKLVLGNDKNDVSPLPSPSFRFGCTRAPLNSFELNCFQSSRCAEPCKLETKEKTPLVSGERISWRNGLLSRIFEMGELDSYVGLSEAEEEFDFSRDANIKSDLDFKIELETGNSVLQEGNGFGSFEFLVKDNKFGVHKCEPKVPPLEPITLAESFSTEGGGLISSGDSDWTLFYKNNLFEV